MRAKKVRRNNFPNWAVVTLSRQAMHDNISGSYLGGFAYQTAVTHLDAWITGGHFKKMSGASNQPVVQFPDIIHRRRSLNNGQRQALRQ